MIFVPPESNTRDLNLGNREFALCNCVCIGDFNILYDWKLNYVMCWRGIEVMCVLIECENVRPLSSGWPLEGKASVGIKLKGCYCKVNLSGLVGEFLFLAYCHDILHPTGSHSLVLRYATMCFTEREKPIYGNIRFLLCNHRQDARKDVYVSFL